MEIAEQLHLMMFVYLDMQHRIRLRLPRLT